MEPVSRYADAVIPTRFGDLRVVVYPQPDDPRVEHVAVIRGDVQGGPPPLVRVHSECMTSEVLGSLKCDCREQLEVALQRIATAERGVVVYLRQEGRGIGLGNKIRAYALQAQGKDTVEANEALGFEADLRSYETAGAILRDLGVREVRLMTNNPEKIRGLEAAGVHVAEQLSHWMPEGADNREYLQTKRDKLGHLPDQTE
ncbi:MAG: GTP cyclohydrolase II [Deltaproteobacteria bacterium]|nr:GTP cyclohydrolase II [Deltaproteobacteria bacterium]